MQNMTRMIILMEAGMMILTGSSLFIFAPRLMGIFSEDPLVIALGVTVLRMVAVFEPVYGVSIIIEGILQGVGKTMIPFICNIIGMWGVRILGTWICTTRFGMGLVSAWACMVAHILLLFVMFTAYYRTGKWNPMRRAGER